MNAAEGLWPEEVVAADPGGGDPLAPADDAADPGDAGMGFFFAPAESPQPDAAADAGDHDVGADDEGGRRRPSHDRLSIKPPPRRAAARERARSPEAAIGKLARAVDGLRELESEMGTTLAGADRTLRALGSRDIYESAGFVSYSELEQRLVLATPVLQALRLAIRRSPVTLVAKASVELHPRRSTRALVSISRAMHRLRSLEEQLLGNALQARHALSDIEQSHLYEECGYTSFEDFLERALGPSPLLSCAVAFVEEPPGQPEEVPPLAETEESAGEEVDESAAMLWSAPDPDPAPGPAPEPEVAAPASRRSRPSVAAAIAGEPSSENALLAEPPAAAVPPAADAAPHPATRPRWISHVVLTILLALVATGVGAASGRIGLRGVPQAEGPDASVLGTTAPVAASAARATPSAIAPSRAPLPAASSAPTPPAPATSASGGRSRLVKPLPTPSVAPAHAARTEPKPSSKDGPDSTTDALDQALGQAVAAKVAATAPGRAMAH